MISDVESLIFHEEDSTIDDIPPLPQPGSKVLPSSSQVTAGKPPLPSNSSFGKSPRHSSHYQPLIPELSTSSGKHGGRKVAHSSEDDDFAEDDAKHKKGHTRRAQRRIDSNASIASSIAFQMEDSRSVSPTRGALVSSPGATATGTASRKPQGRHRMKTSGSSNTAIASKHASVEDSIQFQMSSSSKEHDGASTPMPDFSNDSIAFQVEGSVAASSISREFQPLPHRLPSPRAPQQQNGRDQGKVTNDNLAFVFDDHSHSGSSHTPPPGRLETVINNQRRHSSGSVDSGAATTSKTSKVSPQRGGDAGSSRTSPGLPRHEDRSLTFRVEGDDELATTMHSESPEIHIPPRPSGSVTAPTSRGLNGSTEDDRDSPPIRLVAVPSTALNSYTFPSSKPLHKGDGAGEKHDEDSQDEAHPVGFMLNASESGTPAPPNLASTTGPGAPILKTVVSNHLKNTSARSSPAKRRITANPVLQSVEHPPVTALNLPRKKVQSPTTTSPKPPAPSILEAPASTKRIKKGSHRPSDSHSEIAASAQYADTTDPMLTTHTMKPSADRSQSASIARDASEELGACVAASADDVVPTSGTSAGNRRCSSSATRLAHGMPTLLMEQRRAEARKLSDPSLYLMGIPRPDASMGSTPAIMVPASSNHSTAPPMSVASPFGQSTSDDLQAAAGARKSSQGSILGSGMEAHARSAQQRQQQQQDDLRHLQEHQRTAQSETAWWHRFNATQRAELQQLQGRIAAAKRQDCTLLEVNETTGRTAAAVDSSSHATRTATTSRYAARLGPRGIPRASSASRQQETNKKRGSSGTCVDASPVPVTPSQNRGYAATKRGSSSSKCEQNPATLQPGKMAPPLPRPAPPPRTSFPASPPLRSGGVAAGAKGTQQAAQATLALLLGVLWPPTSPDELYFITGSRLTQAQVEHFYDAAQLQEQAEAEQQARLVTPPRQTRKERGVEGGPLLLKEASSSTPVFMSPSSLRRGGTSRPPESARQSVNAYSAGNRGEKKRRPVRRTQVLRDVFDMLDLQGRGILYATDLPALKLLAERELLVLEAKTHGTQPDAGSSSGIGTVYSLLTAAQEHRQLYDHAWTSLSRGYIAPRSGSGGISNTDGRGARSLSSQRAEAEHTYTEAQLIHRTLLLSFAVNVVLPLSHASGISVFDFATLSMLVLNAVDNGASARGPETQAWRSVVAQYFEVLSP